MSNKSKAEQYYEEELGKLLLHSIHAHNGKLEEEIYRILNEGEVLSDPCGIEAAATQLSAPHEQIPETGSDIMKLREAPIRFPSFPSIIPPAQLAQYYRNTDGDHGSVPNQADLLYQDLCRSFNQNFKEYVFTDREHGISIRINFQQEKK